MKQDARWPKGKAILQSECPMGFGLLGKSAGKSHLVSSKL